MFPLQSKLGEEVGSRQEGFPGCPLDQLPIQGMQHMQYYKCYDASHSGGRSQTCSPSAECPTSGLYRKILYVELHI